MEQKYSKVVLHTGSNISPRSKFLQKANAMIEARIGKIIHQSSIYETEAWGKEEQNHFLNQALLVSTTLTAWEVLEKIFIIEELLGRERTQKWGSRSIDIDILFFNDEIIRTESLTVPHTFLHERNFVLTPLSEILPDFIHPVFKETVLELKEKCSDSRKVLENSAA